MTDMAIAEINSDERLEKRAADAAEPTYNLITGVYYPDVVPETRAGREAGSSQYDNLASTLFDKPSQYFSNPTEQLSEAPALNQHFADQIAGGFFDLSHMPIQGTRYVPAYQMPNPELKGKDNAAILQHEKDRWSSIFECIKLGGGVFAAHRWAPTCMPPEVAPIAHIASRNPTGVHQMLYSGPTRAELVKEMKARYTASCIGGMAAGWAVSHALDSLLFPHEQYMEGTLVGDISGIGLAILAKGFPRKAALVAATHLLGKTIDHWRQPHEGGK